MFASKILKGIKFFPLKYTFLYIGKKLSSRYRASKAVLVDVM